jgi:hypothetical protein
LGWVFGTGLTLLAVIVVFLVCREIVTWYWKINEAVRLLGKIEEHLRPK